MMSIHESQVFELRVEMRFEVCDPRSFFFFNATNVAKRKTRTGCEPWPLQSVLYLLSYPTKWELFVVWVDYKPADNESRSTDMILIHESRVFETTGLLSTNITSSSQLVLTGEVRFRISLRHEFLRPYSLLYKWRWQKKTWNAWVSKIRDKFSFHGFWDHWKPKERKK